MDGRSGHDAAWALLRALYREVTGEEELPPIVYGPRGKPDFASSPWHFSLTHTPRRAWAALSKAPIGIDAEERDRSVSPRLADKILSPAEREAYDAAPDKNLALLCFWVLKEASAKQTGEGLRGYPNQTAFTLDDPRLTVTENAVVAAVEESRHGPGASALGAAV